MHIELEASVRSTSRIGDHGIIGDCRTAALISRCGAIDWLCLPHFSGPSIFGAILDSKKGGQFDLHPAGRFSAAQRYRGDAPILETEFESAQGRVRVTDFMTVADGVHPMRPLREIVRMVEGLAGGVDLDIAIEPRPDYGRTTPRLQNRGGMGWAWLWDNEIAVLRSDIPMTPQGVALKSPARIAAGERRYLSFSYAHSDPAVFPLLGDHADARLQQTERWWRAWSARSAYEGPYREAVQRSATVLQLLSYVPSGAIVAAPTTSLPESVGADRNWDYRYCWLRDAGLTAQALVGLGYIDEAAAFTSWLLHATRLTWPELQIVYDVYGRTGLREEHLPHLSGYAASRPVRIGNEAVRQRQLDVYGETIGAADTIASAGVPLDPVEGRMLKAFGRTVCKQWREPDSGVWEIRGAPRHYTLSKAMCCIALDRLLRMHARGILSLGRLEETFRQERDRIHDAIEARGFNCELGSYTSELDGVEVDASLLLLPCIGYIDPDNERMRGTFARIWNELQENRLLRRYRAGFDGMNAPEGAFGICCFWAVDNLAKRGDLDEAEGLFEHLLGYATELGLFGEEIDVRTGEPLGNFPQAFTHVGLINAALAIESARKAR